MLIKMVKKDANIDKEWGSHLCGCPSMSWKLHAMHSNRGDFPKPVRELISFHCNCHGKPFSRKVTKLVSGLGCNEHQKLIYGCVNAFSICNYLWISGIVVSNHGWFCDTVKQPITSIVLYPFHRLSKNEINNICASWWKPETITSKFRINSELVAMRKR